jgi:DNA-binding transcriptional LysR family regulator
MDIHHIRYFLAVCETLNFTRAAEKCHVAQPALSRAIQQLEEEVGGLLFSRERNKTHLTDLGLLMKPRLTKVIDELTDVKREAKRFLTLEKASLNLGVMCTVGPTRFTGLLVHFAQDFPGITLKIIEGNPVGLSRKLQNGDIDVAIMASPDGIPERFEYETLFRERFVVAFPMGHRFARMNAVPITAVDGEIYLRRLNCEYYDQLSDLVDEGGASSPLGYESEREDWIQNMIAGGLGICFIPEFSATIPGIQTRPLMDPEVWRDVCLVTMPARRHSPAVSKFLSALREYPFPTSEFPIDDTMAVDA